MDELTYELRALCRRNRDGSHATQADRSAILTLVSRQLLDSRIPANAGHFAQGKAR